MKNVLRVVLAISVLLPATLASSQMTAPKPGPEVQKLTYFVGNWTMDADMKPGPMGPGGKVTGISKSDWLPGGFFVESREEFKGPPADSSDLSIMGYNPDDKVYTYRAFTDSGEASSYTATVNGDTWTWTGDEKMGGQSFKGKYTINVLTPTTYHFRFEMSPDGATWMTVMEGKATKSK